ncbi:flagellar biosynthetic protein FliO [Cellulomonas sp. URHD0024]|uniref:flagellar biosynthetic protein FliO n=1 Tax=Cellulomonas sp. URHD0024 TaxID=1302620 RepID=UPI000411A898|nr:flagellar biosynthetic protein FliO [Cellulomonas sp. URHD0024]
MLTATFVLRLLLALTCVVGLIWYIGRRFGNGGSQQRTSREPGVKIVGRQSMGKHAGVAVVAVGPRRILVGYGDQQVSMLTELGPVFEELPAPKVTASTAEAAGAPWVSVVRATKAAAAGMLPTPRSRKASAPTAITPQSLAAAGVPAPPVAPTVAKAPKALKALDASPIDRLDKDSWPTLAEPTVHVAPAVPRAAATPAPAPVAVAAATAAPAAPAVVDVATTIETPVGPELAGTTSGPAHSALAGSILAPDTWRQALRSLQDRTVRH